MPPKKRAASTDKDPPTKVTKPPLCCRYATKKNPCHGECREMTEIYTDKKVVLCPDHRKCWRCHNEVDDGEFAVMYPSATCVLPVGTPNRFESTCAAWCGRCTKFVLKHDLSEDYYENGATDDEPLFCEDCWSQCEECGKYAHCVEVESRLYTQSLCLDCIPAGATRKVSVSYVID